MPGATPDLQRPFDCPTCGSNEYTGVIFPGTRVGAYRAPLYQCCGCTIVFTDPEKLSRLVRFTWDEKFRWRTVKATRETNAYPKPYNAADWMNKPKP